MDELQEYLNDSTGERQCANDSPNSRDQGRDLREMGTSSDPSARSGQTAPTEMKAADDDSNLNLGLRRRGQRRTQTQESALGTSNTWILPISQYERHGTKVEHLSVDLNMSDETLFTMVKAKYHEGISRLRRFFAMRGVKKISYVKVRTAHTVMSFI